MPLFNLVDSSWIPVRYVDGTNRLVSLDTVYREAASIADLDCPPHERIALTRLLVGLTQAELGSPDSSDDWDDFGSDLESRLPAALHRPEVHPHFELFGDGPRFLQTRPPEKGLVQPTSKLFHHLASGNNPTHLDHEGGTPRKFRSDKLARALLTYQSFFVGGSMGPPVKGNGPCINFLHCLLIGQTLKATIILNCLDSATLDLHFPILGTLPWDAATRASSGYLNRLFPMPYALWITSDRLSVHVENALPCPEYPEQRDSFATTRAFKDQRRLLRADLEKGLWRDLHVITVLRTATAQEQQAPLNLQSHAHEYADRSARIWLGEFVKAKDAKIIDSVESAFTVPTALFNDKGRARYAVGVEYADHQSNQLYGAIKQYRETLGIKLPPTDRDKQHYWHALEQNSHRLLEIVADSEPLADDFGVGNDPWTEAVRAAALAAYEKSCPRQTPRQRRAFATGLRALRPKAAKQKSTTATA